MSGLLLIIAEPGGARLAAAVELAAAAAALGRPVRLFLTGPAAGACHAPPLAAALALMAELGADVGICQTAMAAHGITADMLPEGIQPEGMVHLLSGRADWQLLLA